MLMSFDKVIADDPPISGDYSYEIVLEETFNGYVLSDRWANEDDVVTITVVGNEYEDSDTGTIKTYIPKHIIISDRDGGDLAFQRMSETEFAFVMPASEVTVTVEFTNGGSDLQFYSHHGLSGGISIGAYEAVVSYA